MNTPKSPENPLDEVFEDIDESLVQYIAHRLIFLLKRLLPVE